MKFNFKQLWKTKKVLILLFTILFFTVLFVHLWSRKNIEHRVIYWDTINYYSFLPATFIHGDLAMRFLNEGVQRDTSLTWLYWTFKKPNGKHLVKMTLAWSMINIPAFVIADVIAILTGFERDGYSKPYQIAVALNNVFFGCWGLYFVFLILSRFFQPFIRDLCLVIISLGTNFYYYASWTQPGAHIYGFFLVAALTELAFRIRDKFSWKLIVYAGICFGLLTLLRPVNALVVFVIASILFKYSTDFSFLSITKKLHIKAVFLFGLISLIVIAPQFIYWKWITGSWIHFSYEGERFFWSRPMIVEFLFSYRKGWLTYSPLMLIACIGFWMNHTFSKNIRLSLLLFLMVFVYLNSCWWSWWFGGGFGCRPMIDFYPLMAIPLGVVLEKISAKHLMFKINSFIVIGFLVFLSVFQTQQRIRGLIHWDSMTKEAYWRVFLKSTYPHNYDEFLKTPDYEAAMRGEVVR